MEPRENIKLTHIRASCYIIDIQTIFHSIFGSINESLAKKTRKLANENWEMRRENNNDISTEIRVEYEN